MKNVADIYPLLPMQLGMLFHTLAQQESASQSAKQTGVYINQYTCLLKGEVDFELFHQAWVQTVDRHPVLRTAFLWEGLDEPLQVVRQTVVLPWQILDWRKVEAGEQQARLEGFLRRDRMHGFDLAKAPASRLTLIRLDEAVVRLVWSSHHILFDGWSLPLIWQDVLTYYEALLKGREPRLEAIRPFRDYVAWQKERESAADEQFWRSQLAGFAEPTPLPAAITGSTEGHLTGPSLYAQQSARLSDDLTAQLGVLARQNRLTLNTLIQGAWALLLHHFTGGEQVTYGSVVSGRPAALGGVEKMVGLFINTLPVRVSIERDLPLVAWLSERQQQLLALREYEVSALSDIQKWSDLPSGTPLFETIVVFENYPAMGRTDVGFTIEAVQDLEQSNYPLALLVVPGESLELMLLYDTARFEMGAIARLQQHLELLLTAFVAQPQAKLSELPRLTAAEQAQLTNWPQCETDLTICELIEAQVRRTPAAEAVVFEGQSLTYGELNERADELAAELRSRGVVSGDRVALCLNRSLDMVACILAVLKTGAAYVPLDPDYPQSRLAYCLEDTAPRIVCTERSVELPVESTARLYVDEALAYRSAVDANGIGEAQSADVSAAGPEDLAYIIYTSGSTGRPKGVMVSHRNLVHSTMARFSVYSEEVGRFLLLSSIAFDSSVAGLFWTLCQGGALVISPQRIEQDLQRLAALISKERITHTLCVPTLYSLLLNDADVVQLATLRTVIVAGEACARSLVKQHYAKLPNAQLYNEYGPTEATVWCTAYRVPRDLPPGPVAIGPAISGTQIVLLDSHAQPVPTGAIGEIYVGGLGVTQGYLNQAEKTDAAFLAGSRWIGEMSTPQGVVLSAFYRTGDLARLRSDDSLEWLGRSDRQVKVRGYRIELGEIEEALRSQPNVREAVVTARQDVSSSTAIDSEDRESLSRALLELSWEEADALLSAVEGDV